MNGYAFTYATATATTMQQPVTAASSLFIFFNPNFFFCSFFLLFYFYYCMHPSPSLELCRTYFTAVQSHQHCYAFVSSSSSLLPLCKHVKPNFECVGLKKGFLYILACFLFIRICVVGRMKTRADDNSGSAMEEATLLSVAAIDRHTINTNHIQHLVDHRRRLLYNWTLKAMQIPSLCATGAV